MNTIPVLETERLMLRAWRTSDFDAYADFSADPQTMRFLGGVQNRNDAWRNFATIIGHWTLRGHGFWAVERKADGAMMGRIGLWRPEGWPGLEIGWTLARPYWSQGYASEAAKAARDFGFAQFAVDRLISLIDPENAPSRRVAQAIGETKAEPFDLLIAGKTYPVDIWEIPRQRWTELREKGA
jgi:RimJ/RimL family protein N-acetyltransferase